MAKLTVLLLGPPHFECEHKPIEIGRRKGIALLVYLALTGQRHHRDELATLLWPASSQSRARGNLRHVLSELNQALDLSWLELEGETVSLNQDVEFWLDVDQFRRQLAACQAHGHPIDDVCPACLPPLTEAVALYRHDFLAGFTLRNSPEFDEWQFFQAESLRQELAAALERLVRGHSAQEQFEPAIGYARRWLALDPLHEPVQRQLMQLYARTGQRAAALRQYAACERLLEEELGLPPEEATVRVCEAIKEKRVLPPPTGKVTPSRRKPSSQRLKAKVASRPDRFRIERKLGEGGMGEVWLATDTVLDRQVALKRPGISPSAGGAERLLQEARLLASLNHPNITAIHDFFIDQGESNFYLVLEYVEGKDLSEIIRQDAPLPLDIILEITRGILRALGYAHQQGVVHYDVKPANVMIGDEVKLTDFGLANLRSMLERGTGFMAGTPAYMAPEQIEGRPTDGRADLYSLGVLLFELLSGGQLPFDNADEDELMEAHLHTAPRPLSQFVPDIPPALEQIIMRLLTKDPEERYPSAEAVMEVLETLHVGPKLGNLPAPLTPFVGREAELAEIQDRLRDPACRLLTLVGPGGIGKTRLALEAARTELDHFVHGVYFVFLAPLQMVEAIVPAVAKALNFSFYEKEEPQQQLLDYLRQKNMLLIMDNFEHLLTPAEEKTNGGAGLVVEMLRAVPSLKILTTSRARLNVKGEHLFSVAGMDFPDEETMEDVAQYSAIQLFLQSARRTQPNFDLTTSNLTDVVQVCRLVEGMPLAILLAAAWVEMLTPAEIVAEVKQSIDFLETDLRDVPERQRSLRAVFDHSWRLLTEREREVFQGLSVFRGGFTREAAQGVTGASLRTLMGLVNKSLLQRTSAGRYGMHELLRQFATEKLETLGEAGAARDAHSAYYAEFLRQREVDLEGRRQLGALDEIEADFENARAAWNWALKQRNYTAIGQLSHSLGWFCVYRSRDQEYKELYREAREQLAPGPDNEDDEGEPHRVWCRILVGEFYARPREVDRTQIERGLAIAQKYSNRKLMAVCLRALGVAASNADDHTEALSYHEVSLTHFRALDDSLNIAATLYLLAETYKLLGQPDEAINFARQSLDQSREIGDKFWAVQSLANTGVIALYTGNYAEAEGYLQEANTINREMGFRERVAESNVVLGKLAFLQGDFEAAKALAEEALEIATDLGNKRIARSAYFLPTFVMEVPNEFNYEHPDEQELVPIIDLPPTIDRFEIKKLLGAGSLGAVYLAHDLNSGRDVALKVAYREALKQTNGLSWLRDEAEVITKLAHPALAECYGYGETADCAYIALEYIAGKDLEDRLEEQEGFLAEMVVIEWALQMCDALTYMHSQRPELLIFRDLKPANVMVDNDGQVRLIDFGIVEPYRPGQELPLIGTEGYSPPEQYVGYSDTRSDIYALGATLHHLLTRRDPRKETPFSFHEAPPRSLNPAISEELTAVILKAVEYKAEDRYQSAAEMKSALLACL